MSLSILQIILIVLLVAIVPIGIWNQKRMIQRKKEIENFNYNDNNKAEISSSQILSSQEQNAKTYIEQYKSQYSKESLKKALINNGSSESDVNIWIEKYY